MGAASHQVYDEAGSALGMTLQPVPSHVRWFVLASMRQESRTVVRCDLMRGESLFATRSFGDDGIEDAAQLGRLWLSIGPAVLVVER